MFRCSIYEYLFVRILSFVTVLLDSSTFGALSVQNEEIHQLVLFGNLAFDRYNRQNTRKGSRIVQSSTVHQLCYAFSTVEPLLHYHKMGTTYDKSLLGKNLKFYGRQEEDCQSLLHQSQTQYQHGCQHLLHELQDGTNLQQVTLGMAPTPFTKWHQTLVTKMVANISDINFKVVPTFNILV